MGKFQLGRWATLWAGAGLADTAEKFVSSVIPSGLGGAGFFGLNMTQLLLGAGLAWAVDTGKIKKGVGQNLAIGVAVAEGGKMLAPILSGLTGGFGGLGGGGTTQVTSNPTVRIVGDPRLGVR